MFPKVFGSMLLSLLTIGLVCALPRLILEGCAKQHGYYMSHCTCNVVGGGGLERLQFVTTSGRVMASGTGTVTIDYTVYDKLMDTETLESLMSNQGGDEHEGFYCRTQDNTARSLGTIEGSFASPPEVSGKLISSPILINSPKENLEVTVICAVDETSAKPKGSRVFLTLADSSHHTVTEFIDKLEGPRDSPAQYLFVFSARGLRGNQEAICHAANVEKNEVKTTSSVRFTVLEPPYVTGMLLSQPPLIKCPRKDLNVTVLCKVDEPSAVRGRTKVVLTVPNMKPITEFVEKIDGTDHTPAQYQFAFSAVGLLGSLMVTCNVSFVEKEGFHTTADVPFTVIVAPMSSPYFLLENGLKATDTRTVSVTLPREVALGVTCVVGRSYPPPSSVRLVCDDAEAEVEDDWRVKVSVPANVTSGACSCEISHEAGCHEGNIRFYFKRANGTADSQSKKFSTGLEFEKIIMGGKNETGASTACIQGLDFALVVGVSVLLTAM